MTAAEVLTAASHLGVHLATDGDGQLLYVGLPEGPAGDALLVGLKVAKTEVLTLLVSAVPAAQMDDSSWAFCCCGREICWSKVPRCPCCGASTPPLISVAAEVA